MLIYGVWTIYIIVLFISFFLLIVFLENGGIRDPVEYPEKWPKVTITIPAYNEEETISDTIQSALQTEYPESKKEIIVVNDGSQDQTQKEAQKHTEKENVRLINQENQGKGAALNTGLEKAEGKIFACLDADSYLADDSLKNIVAELGEDEEGLASAMKVHKPQNFLQKLQWVEYLVGIFMRNIMDDINSIHVTPGPLSIYRTDKLREVDGFDNSSLVEDQEICFRFQENHWKVGHSRKGDSLTVAPETWKQFYNQRLRWYKGSIENIFKYKNMMLNSKYGDFGMFAVPTKLVQGVASIAGMFIISYYFLEPFFSFLRDFMVIGTDAIDLSMSEITIPFIINTIQWFVLGLEWITITFLATLIFFSIFLFYIAALHTEEKPLEQGILAPAIYMFWYFIVIGFMWLVSFVSITLDIILDREKRWT